MAEGRWLFELEPSAFCLFPSFFRLMPYPEPMLRTWLLAALLTTQAGGASPDLKAESVEGEGEVLLKVTNVSRQPLLIWDDSCHRHITTRLNGVAIPFSLQCGFDGNHSFTFLPPGDFLLERRPVNFPTGVSTVTQSITLRYSRDPRTDEQRAKHGQPMPGPGCSGIPCPPQPHYGTGQSDPLNPLNFPRPTVKLVAEPLKVTRP